MVPVEYGIRGLAKRYTIGMMHRLAKDATGTRSPLGLH